MDRLFCAAVNDTISSSANVSNPYVRQACAASGPSPAPSKFRDTPANFHRRGKMRAKFSAQQAGKADKFIVLPQMEGKQRIAVLFAMRHDARQKSCAFIAALRGGKNSITSASPFMATKSSTCASVKFTKSNLSVCKIGSNLPIALTLGDLPLGIYAVAHSIIGTKMNDRTHAMLTEPPLRLLLQMTAPNTLAFTLQACVNLAEIYMIGRLGGGAGRHRAGFSFADFGANHVRRAAGRHHHRLHRRRALGNGNRDNAERLVWHAIYGAFIGAAVFFLLFVLFGRQLLMLLGGEGAILEMAMSYCWVLFSAGLILWLGSTLGAAYRGAGDMAFPAKLMIFSAMLQVPLTAILVFGLFGAPALGVTGAAASSVFVGAIMVSVLLVELLRGQRAISLRMHQRAGDGHWPQTFSKWRVRPA